MRILLLGATGPTGRHLLELLGETEHDVVALVRDPARLDGYVHPRLETFIGDATRPLDVARAMSGQEAVVSALGAGSSVRSRGMFEAAATAVTEAAQVEQLDRLVWLSSFGVGASFAAASLVQKGIYSTLLRSLYADKAVADDLVRASGLNWTIVHPTRLTDGPAARSYKAADRLPMAGNPTISRADVAHFMLTTLEDSTWSRRTAVISD